MGGKPQPIVRRSVVVVLLPHVHLLDLAGPVQAFYEASGLGTDYRLVHCGVEATVRTAQGLLLSDLSPLPSVGANDLVLLPGIDSATLDQLGHVPTAWLRRAQESGARICSICSGAFVLAHAGLLDGRACTTHWRVAERLQEDYPRLRVVRNRLFVRDGNVVTSAGVSSGIDMALALLAECHGPRFAAQVAREMVVYFRREGDREQSSVFLDYRTHLNENVHRVQDWLIAHPERNAGLGELAKVAAMSERNLTRVFRQATGVTLKGFGHRIRLQIARDLLQDPSLTLESISSSCGFRDPRQFRRVWKQRFGQSPSQSRNSELRAGAQ